ncbi:MAG: UDP-N-acetylmuramate--L-alanine ligase [Acidimicrobiales bacterium]
MTAEQPTSDAAVVDLSRPRAIHLVGVGGAGISAIAVVLAAMGHTVTGSDVVATDAWPALEAAGVVAEVVAAPDLFAAAARHGAEVLAHSTAFTPAASDIAAAASDRRIVLDRAGILAAICARRPTVAVSGTHGKTSTTAMLATLLDGAGAAPSFLVGAIPLGLGIAARWDGEGDGVFVVEADESDGTFLRLGAQVAVVTNIDADHLDHWGDLAAIEAAFDRFVAEAPSAVVDLDDPRGQVVTDPRAHAIATRHRAMTVGEGPEARLRIADVHVERLTTRFDLTLDGAPLGTFSLGTPGRHHARNAAVAVAVALGLGLDADAARTALARYRGVTRRFEVVGEVRGVTVVDDYAHNPGKVRALLASAQEAGWERVVAIFQPHRYSRTRDLVADLGAALAVADVVAITDVYGAGEDPIDGVGGRLLVDAVFDQRPWAQVAWVPTLDDALAWARATLRPGDLCLTVGAGDVSALAPRLVDALADRSSA